MATPGRFFAMEAQFWLNPQVRYDLEAAADELEGRLEPVRDSR